MAEAKLKSLQSKERKCGGAGVRRSESIKNMMLDEAKNSKFAGVRRDAENGTGNYSFAKSKAVGENKLEEIKFSKIIEKNGYTLIDGVIGGKSVFYANKSDAPEIISFKKGIEAKKKKQAEDIKRTERPEIRTTSTYDKWWKRNKSNFDAWFGIGG